ncbi:hypothetical protein DFH06DRAFT_1326222 [Mycena polygramma]|nr:hypothetical protein DFH06DRAFT_1341969 [Mycena polygramma]KAJ7660976.1 hypothetical protein DFH06DRAFT_1326222 [Mycena polygramma]
MFIPGFKAHEGRESCKPDQPNCTSVAPSGDGSTEDVEHDIGPIGAPTGIHRFIGVISVVVVIILAILLWLGLRAGFGVWLRRKIWIPSQRRPSPGHGKEKNSKGAAEYTAGGTAMDNEFEAIPPSKKYVRPVEV